MSEYTLIASSFAKQKSLRMAEQFIDSPCTLRWTTTGPKNTSPHQTESSVIHPRPGLASTEYGNVEMDVVSCGGGGGGGCVEEEGV